MADTHKIPTHTGNHRGYEASDANVVSLTKFGIGLAIVAAVVLVLMLWLQNFLAAQNQRVTPPASPLAAQRQAPPAPRLQVAPARDLHDIRMLEDSVLHSYGWVVRDSGVVRIPIERAMELIAQRGLPVRQSKMEDRKPKMEDGGLKQ
ncbi:MAG: hypothetical protein ONB46_07645 [candidate division KSB1 bacterium]|nr:hypothetical protein [candidate division KSB1 bacterium]MDZ7365518.1 hypothetical protein [candidate division KSB1 bacterium]MDZ7403621.1 hypothetical protein [candidate division KSB1 bacterium]